MFEKLRTPEEAYNYKLGSALTMERDIVEMLDGLIEESRDETLKQLLRVHQEETRGHARNIEQAFAAFGWEVDDSPCIVVEAIDKEGKLNIRKADESLVDSITTHVTFSATRCSRNARICDVVAPHVVTVDDARLRPWPAIRTQTFASFFEQSIPAHRGCTTSTQTHHLPTGLTKEVFRGERGETEF